MPEICLLGTGGMLPLKNRFLTSLYVEQNGKALLIDCGEGTQVAMGMHEIKMSRIEMLLITHAHADHITGLPGLLLSIGNCSRTQPLDIYMPESCENAVKALISVCGTLPYEVVMHTIPDNESVTITAEKVDSMLTISTLPLRHKVKCLGYSMTFRRKPVFSPEKAKSLEVPLEYWKKLHCGESVKLSDGRTIKTDDVTDGRRDSVKITYTTDTLPFDEIADFAENSDLFVCEGMYGSSDKKESMNEKGHMLMTDSCILAEKSKSKRLWLTHYSPAEKHPEEFEEMLKGIYENVTISHDGIKITL
ncbi:MAG: ribonuclease Z [Ruminococcus sp.]|nr:ribonuclease Z [Ruminococcus sp.]